jgi:phosphoribosylformimino-5-aminoimidazole carboxamide ribotide isomerase
VYDDHPANVAGAFAATGVEWIHVVDLDAARTGEPANLAVIEKIAGAVRCNVQVGGGVRSAQAAASLLLAGAARVVVGTAAVEDPLLIDALCRDHPGRVAVGLDARGREVAVRGWTEGSGHDLVDVAARFAASGVACLIVTEIGVDGTMEGPSLDQLREVVAVTEIPVIASGGIGGLGDLAALAELEAAGRRLAGAIVGRALYEGRFTLAEALAAVA